MGEWSIYMYKGILLLGSLGVVRDFLKLFKDQVLQGLLCNQPIILHFPEQIDSMLVMNLDWYFCICVILYLCYSVSVLFCICVILYLCFSVPEFFGDLNLLDKTGRDLTNCRSALTRLKQSVNERHRNVFLFFKRLRQ